MVPLLALCAVTVLIVFMALPPAAHAVVAPWNLQMYMRAPSSGTNFDWWSNTPHSWLNKEMIDSYGPYLYLWAEKPPGTTGTDTYLCVNWRRIDDGVVTDLVSDVAQEDLGFGFVPVNLGTWGDGRYKWFAYTWMSDNWSDYFSDWSYMSGEDWDVGLDSLPPNLPNVASATHPAGTYSSKDAAVVTLSSADSLSGLSGYSWSQTAGSPGDAPKTVNFWGGNLTATFSTSGTHYVNTRGRDVAGNWSSTSSREFRIDTVEPTAYAPRTVRTYRRGRAVKMYWKAADPYTGGRVKVLLGLQKYNSRRRRYLTVYTAARFWGFVNPYWQYKARVIRVAGRYRSFVTVWDQAGNKSWPAYSGRIYVR